MNYLHKKKPVSKWASLDNDPEVIAAVGAAAAAEQPESKGGGSGRKEPVQEVKEGPQSQGNVPIAEVLEVEV